MVEWIYDGGFTRLVVDGITRGWFDQPGDGPRAWQAFGLDGESPTEAEAAQHVVKHAWLAGHIVGAPTLSDGTVLRLDVESLRADLAAKEAETNALRELLAVAVEMEGGE